MLHNLLEHTDILLDSLYDGVVIVDQKGDIIYANEAHARITDLRVAEVLGKPVHDVVPTNSIEQVLETGESRIGVRTQVGKRIVVSNIVPIREEGQVVGAISVFRDITEVIQLTEELKLAEDARDHYRDQLQLLGMDSKSIIGANPRIQRAYTIALKSAKVNSTVLIRGESGTGKEIVAQFIHENSDRREEPFLAVNCAAFPETLLESELFGYAPGAFTGARTKGKAGLFELADKGTLFLDEIGDISHSLQAKLLRVLQTKEFQRVGGTETLKVDVHILAATNRPLEEMIAKKEFRQDLYYRLNVIVIHLPPLRERKEDLHLFIDYFIDKLNEKLGTTIQGVEREALDLLFSYDYPGNLRQLENILEQALVMSEGKMIQIRDLPSDLRQQSSEDEFTIKTDGYFPTLEDMEKELIKRGLVYFPSKSELADYLNISRATLYRKLKKYGLWEG